MTLREGNSFRGDRAVMVEGRILGARLVIKIASWDFPGGPVAAAVAAKSLQSCPTLCDPTDSSPPGASVPGFSRQEYWRGLPFPSPGPVARTP